MTRTWLLAIAVMAGCGKGGAGGPSPQKLYEDKRAEMSALVEPVRAKVVGDLPPLTADGLTGVTGPLITWLKPDGNAVLLTEPQLKEMRKGGKDGASIGGATHAGVDTGELKLYGTIEFSQLLDWAFDKSFAFRPYDDLKDAAAAQRKLDHIFALRWVIVIRILEYTTAEVLADSKYKPGHLVAEARVFDLKGTDHGGFRFEGTSSDKVQGSDLGKDFALDIESNAKVKFGEALNKLAPGSSEYEDFVLLH